MTVGTFSCFLKNDFSPSAFTSDLLQNAENQEHGMDVDMCLKMLSMYLDTIDTDLRDVVLQNQESLFKEIKDVETMKSEYKGIMKEVEDISSRFNSIKDEVNSTCRSINENALQLSHFNAVIVLLRQIATFRSGIKKIRGFLSDATPSQRAWLRAQKTLQEVEKAYVDGRLDSRRRGEVRRRLYIPERGEYILFCGSRPDS